MTTPESGVPVPSSPVEAGQVEARPGLVAEEALTELIDTLSPADLATHPELAPVYRAASEIAVASYHGHFNTRPIRAFPDALEPLVTRLLGRYRGDSDLIKFPLVWGDRFDELTISASAMTAYRLRRYPRRGTSHNTLFYTSVQRG